MKGSKKPINFILIGPPGCGKGTQAKLLLKKFKNHYYVYPGEIFRKLFSLNTDAGNRIKKIGESGGLQPEDFAITLWMHEIAFNVKENQGFLLDGSPRKIGESDSLFNFLKFLDRIKTTIVFLVDISKKESYKRLSNRVDATTGRAIKRVDDSKKRIDLRWKLYEEDTVPAINRIKKHCKMVKINGEQSIENVFKDISKNIR
ncbi:MAG: nucleoside monophosphate kinase [Candidatus Portnoybacteria bacterium]|nr:nucleoside monophosphate kinase [Candidatus Portnoybacteria bacterium]